MSVLLRYSRSVKVPKCGHFSESVSGASLQLCSAEGAFRFSHRPVQWISDTSPRDYGNRSGELWNFSRWAIRDIFKLFTITHMLCSNWMSHLPHEPWASWATSKSRLWAGWRLYDLNQVHEFHTNCIVSTLSHHLLSQRIMPIPTLTRFCSLDPLKTHSRVANVTYW